MTASIVLTASLLLCAQNDAAPNLDLKQRPPEMEMLENLQGTWVLGDPGVDRPRGRHVFELVLEGRFLKQSIYNHAGRLYGFYLFTYDPSVQMYRQWHFTRAFYSGIQSDGQWDAETKTFTFTGKTPKATVTNTIRLLDVNTAELRNVWKNGKGEVTFEAEATARRQNPGPKPANEAVD